MDHIPSIPRGRFAPSPTGGLHLGSALIALVAWLSIRAQKGRFVWRVEDLDRPRIVPGAAGQQMREARWLGLDWDEGPDVGGDFAPYAQSERSAYYEDALAKLAGSKRLFPCTLSRNDLRELASAPHISDGLPPYPKELRPGRLATDWFDDFNSSTEPDAALRFKVDDGAMSFSDVVQGEIIENLSDTVGDFVLKRRDGVYAYQLAVVVDDMAMGMTEVVRGADLIDSTARQIQLITALGGGIPVYAHLPLVVDEQSQKLSKRDKVPSLSQLNESGVDAEAVVGWLAHAAGLLESPFPTLPRDLISQFSWDRIIREPIVAPDNMVDHLLSLA